MLKFSKKRRDLLIKSQIPMSHVVVVSLQIKMNNAEAGLMARPENLVASLYWPYSDVRQ